LRHCSFKSAPRKTLLDDAIRLAKVAGGADVRVGLQIWPEMIHVWHLFHPELTAGLRAIEEAGRSYARCFSGEGATVRPVRPEDPVTQ
jgi:monoterpene epsilon-lactone hydrolase